VGVVSPQRESPPSTSSRWFVVLCRSPEAVRSDRNLYSKNLIESQEEIAEMKRRFKIMNHQIEQLKEEITAKDHALVKEHFNHHNVDKEKESLKNELTKIRKQIVSSEQIIANQRAEIQKLTQIIHEADEERQRQRKEHEAVVGERNILGSQARLFASRPSVAVRSSLSFFSCFLLLLSSLSLSSPRALPAARARERRRERE